MIKQEILEKHHIEFDVDSDWLFDGDFSQLLKAMDEYAKEQAIAFHDWVFDNYDSIPSSFGCCYKKRGPEETETPTLTTRMLYKIFSQTQTTNT
jgi:hypothetical protein